jgi:hypothetical protein
MRGSFIESPAQALPRSLDVPKLDVFNQISKTFINREI